MKIKDCPPPEGEWIVITSDVSPDFYAKWKIREGCLDQWLDDHANFTDWEYTESPE